MEVLAYTFIALITAIGVTGVIILFNTDSPWPSPPAKPKNICP